MCRLFINIEKGVLLQMDIQTITAADIDRMQAADPRTADRSTLKDIRDVNVDTELPKKERSGTRTATGMAITW